MDFCDKILIIDDEVNFLQSIVIGMKKVGIEVDTASSGEVGFQKFQDQGYDCIVCDVDLPDTTGWKLAKEIIKERPTTRVIFITGGDIKKVEEIFKDYMILKKPFEFGTLLNLLNTSNANFKNNL
jgi:DNA-binding response OmpR family regulator